MKKLFYWAAGLALVVTIFYTNLEGIANWAMVKEGKNPPKDPLPYFKNEYIVVFPKDSIAAIRLVDSLKVWKLQLLHKCSCSPRFQLWGTDPNLPELRIKLTPDQDVPVMMSIQAMKGKKGLMTPVLDTFKGYVIARNYKIRDDLPFERVGKAIDPSILRLSEKNPKASQVTVAVIDTGVDTLNSTVKPYLFQNTPDNFVCEPPQREGIYGLNMLYVAPASSHSSAGTGYVETIEPLDKDGVYITSRLPYSLIRIYRAGHGTMVNGIIAGLGWYPNQPDFANNTRVKLKLLNVKVASKRKNSEPEASLYDALCGIHYALAKGAQVINASWRVDPLAGDGRNVRNAFVFTLSKITEAQAILVTSAGNDKLKGTEALTKIWPAAFAQDRVFSNNVIAVGSWDTESGNISETCNEGPFIDVYAPGKNIRLIETATYFRSWPFPAIFYASQSGSSLAVPFVTRKVALLKGLSPENTPERIKTLITENSIAVGSVRRFDPYE